jgi:hypothetical protein
MSLKLTQSLTEMTTRNISLGGKGGQCIGPTTFPISCASCLEILNPQTPGNLGAFPGMFRDSCTFTLLCTRVVAFVDYVNIQNEPTGTDNQQLSEKILTL